MRLFEGHKKGKIKIKAVLIYALYSKEIPKLNNRTQFDFHFTEMIQFSKLRMLHTNMS